MAHNTMQYFVTYLARKNGMIFDIARMSSWLSDRGVVSHAAEISEAIDALVSAGVLAVCEDFPGFYGLK